MSQSAWFLSSLGHLKLLIFTSSCFALGLCAYMFVQFLVPVAKSIAISSLPVAAAVLFRIVYLRYVSPNTIRVSAKESSRRNKMPWRSLGASFTNSVILGLAVFVGFVAKPGEAWLAVLALGMMGLLCAVAMIIDGGMQLERLNSERFQLRSTLPIAALGLLPMPFVDWPWRFVFCALLLLGFLPQAMTNINAVAESMRFYRLSPMRAYPSSRQVNVIGFAAGHAMGFFIFGDFLQDSVQGMVITLLMLITLLIILSAFLFKDGYPPVDLEAAETSLAAPDKTEAPGRYKWRLKTEAYAKIIGLTSRQSEILMLLARGYSTKSIEERLYISEHTAKSHIYNIYQKAGVHTRQEIIKLIEQVELAPEDALAGMPQADARPSDSATP